MHPHAPTLKKLEKGERQRSNWLMRYERRAIAWLCPRVPRRVTSNMLTAVGLFGSAVLSAALIFGRGARPWLLLGIVGLAINWLGDSLDGRLAYHRNRPRKWFGFGLDLMTDWISLCSITAGIALYLPRFKFIPVAFMAVYGARMLIAVLSYKIRDEYRIDSGKVGPTEVRLLMGATLIAEVVWPGLLAVIGLFGTLALAVVDGIEMRNLLALADLRDLLERNAMKSQTEKQHETHAHASVPSVRTI